MNWFQRFYWTKLSKPAGERPLCEYLIKTPIGSVLQLGMGNGALTRKVLQLARPAGADGVIRFAGVDAFESAEAAQQHMKLKDAHRMCAELGVKAHLIPGELKSALPRVAVTILPSDLLIVERLLQRRDDRNAMGERRHRFRQHRQEPAVDLHFGRQPDGARDDARGARGGDRLHQEDAGDCREGQGRQSRGV